MTRQLIAYCGVDCENCADYTAKTCPSCRKSEWEEGDECMPVACCKTKGITCCGECAAFPCPDMADFYRESESHARAYELMKKANSGRTEE